MRGAILDLGQGDLQWLLGGTYVGVFNETENGGPPAGV